MAICMVEMAKVHWYMQIQGMNQLLDYSGINMVLIIKLSSFSACCFDGTRPEEELGTYQRLYQIREFPSLLEFLGYTMFFNGFWSGPAYEFQHYRNFINYSAIIH
jgi:lysophospholipid acyltransferase